MREVVALLRERKVAAVVLDSGEVLQAAHRLRQEVERAAGPGLNETWLHAESSTESPEDLLRGVDLWLAVFQDPADWVASTQSQINDLRAQVSAAEAEEFHQGDLERINNGEHIRGKRSNSTELHTLKLLPCAQPSRNLGGRASSQRGVPLRAPPPRGRVALRESAHLDPLRLPETAEVGQLEPVQ